MQHAQKNLAKSTHVVPEMSSWTDGQTDPQTDRHTHQSSQYFATAAADEVVTHGQERPIIYNTHVHSQSMGPMPPFIILDTALQ